MTGIEFEHAQKLQLALGSMWPEEISVDPPEDPAESKNPDSQSVFRSLRWCKVAHKPAVLCFELLQICEYVESGLSNEEYNRYVAHLIYNAKGDINIPATWADMREIVSAPWQARAEALCAVKGIQLDSI